MTGENIVNDIGNGEFRITFKKPIENTYDFSIVAGSHNIRIFVDKKAQFIVGIEGKRETLLSWYRSLDFVHQKTIDELAELMGE